MTLSDFLLEANQVVFSAATGGNGPIGPFTTDTTIMYRKVITNVGYAYSMFTGKYAAMIAFFHEFYFINVF